MQELAGPGKALVGWLLLEWMRKPWFFIPLNSSSKYALKQEDNMSVYNFAQICVHS